jgi:putative heme-binding domain-containing protein
MVFGSLGEQREVFFINDWLNKTTFIFKPKWQGALMTCDGGKWQPFIEGGKSLFRPTDIVFGPDGALWCLSWSRGYGSEFQDGQMTNEGRIYRIAAEGMKPTGISYKPMDKRTVPELVAAFNSPLPVQRTDAQAELLKRGKPIQNELGSELERSDLTTAQETWGISTMGQLAPIMIINDGPLTEDNVNLQTLRSSVRNPRSTLVPDVLAIASEQDSARLRFEVVQAIWHSGDADFVPLLTDMASREKDRLTYFTIWRALRDLMSTDELKQRLHDKRGGVRRAALLALLEDGALSAEEVKAMLKDDDAETQKLAALWIKNTSNEEALPMLRGKGVVAANLSPIKGDPPKITPPASPTTLEAALAALKSADAARGRLLALHPAGATCTACHNIGGRGNPFGPDLTGIGQRADAKHILQSMIEPSAVITEGFNSHVITTAQGVQSGVLLDESGLAVTLGIISGHRSRILRKDIVKHETLPISAMPPFAAMLDAQSCADIAAFLMSDAKPERKEEQKLVLQHNGKVFATYYRSHPQVKRPFLAHLQNTAGTQLTRNFPPHKSDSQDHADMHPGVWLAFGGINGTDFWRNKGRVEVTQVNVLPDGGGLTAESRWLDEKDKEVCRDTTRITFSLNDNKITLHWKSELGSDKHDVVIDGQEEAGLGIRVATSLTVRDGTGHITNSNDQRDEKAMWGKQANWWRYGTDEAAIRITPTQGKFWGHTRDYGVLVINPTTLSDGKKKPTGFTIKQGEVLKLSFDITLE